MCEWFSQATRGQAVEAEPYHKNDLQGQTAQKGRVEEIGGHLQLDPIGTLCDLWRRAFGRLISCLFTMVET